ncbi:MAG: type II and III secretion system protein family protein [Inquilinus sp.]|nr:type II and III secretion system protein family protein [Inquilinus sp.]
MDMLPKRLLRIATVIVIAALSAGPASAQEVEQDSFRQNPAILTGEVSQVDLGLGLGQLVRLPSPAKTVYVADPEIADVEVMSPQLIYLYGRQAGETNLYAIGPDEEIVAQWDIVVGLGVALLNSLIQEENEDATLRARASGNIIVLTGEVDSAEEVANAESQAWGIVPPPEEGGRVINRSFVRGPQQVNLQVRIAEVARSAIEEIGIDWEAVSNSGDFFFSLATGQFLLQDRTTGIVPVVGNRSLLAGYRGGNVSINSLIDALETENLIRILAEPSLTALSGETASFLAGGEFPIPSAVSDEGRVTFEFREFGVSLAFTPTVLSEGRISLHVRPEVSELTNNGAVVLSNLAIPGLSIRRAETTVELGSGQSFVIAGLFQSNFRNSESLTPFLSDLPVLGAMFNRTDFEHTETELVIVVTPYLVTPISADQIALPTDRLAAPAEQVPVARLSGPGAGSMVAGSPIGGLVGSAGFILK